MTIKAMKEAALRQWWDREPWPCIILSVDPGKRAGASIIQSGPGMVGMIRCEGLQTNSRYVEGFIQNAKQIAEDRKIPFFMILEDWGSGGILGIKQWLGLGAQRGAWVRAAILEGIAPRQILYVTQSRWRSRVIEASGVYEEKKDGGSFKTVWRKFKPDEWKDQAHSTAKELFTGQHIPIDPDASESACMGYYAARSDEIGKAFLKTDLKLFGYSFEPVEETIANKPIKTKKKRNGPAKSSNAE
jgi:hypothetical protein